jgi:hypothetical protein
MRWRLELALSVAAGQGWPAGDAPAAGSATAVLAISSSALDTRPVPLPEGDAEAVIRLPSPLRVARRPLHLIGRIGRGLPNACDYLARS